MLTLNKKNNEDDDSIDFLTTLLIRYPEVCSVYYSANGSLLQLQFILQEPLEKKVQAQFKEEITNCILTYIYLAGLGEPQHCEIECLDMPEIGVIKITRDTATLTQKELALIMNYLQDRFADNLVADDLNIPQEDLPEHDDLICFMLNKLKMRDIKFNLIALRDEGRVFVYRR